MCDGLIFNHLRKLKEHKITHLKRKKALIGYELVIEVKTFFKSFVIFRRC